MKILFIFLILCIGLVSAYTAPSYDSVDLVLNTGYTAQTYDSVDLVLGGDIIAPTYSLNQSNNTVNGSLTLFSILWNDKTALETAGQYIFSTNNTGTWVNDSAVNFTTTPNWANVTKVLNSTVGISIGYRWYATDNLQNANSTGIFTLTTTSTPSDSCTYTSGDWEVECSDACNITSNVDLGGNNLILSGVGYFNVKANITNIGGMDFGNATDVCQMVVYDKYQLVI